MQIIIDIDFIEETVHMRDDRGNEFDATEPGHSFFEICPNMIGCALNIWLEEIWPERIRTLNTAEYKALAKAHEKLQMEYARTYAKLCQAEEELEKERGNNAGASNQEEMV